MINDVVEGRNVVVIMRDGGVSVSAYFSEADGRALSFTLSNGSVRDVETKSVWNNAGVAVSGPMAGAQLSAVPSRTSFWFSLVGALPDIEIYEGG